MMADDDGVHMDEGTIHTWLDGELDEAQAARLQAHVGRCGACTAHVAEARGLIAGASRVVGMLDEVPTPIVRPATTPTAGTDLSAWRLLRVTPARAAIAATLVVAVGIALTRGQLARETPAYLKAQRAPLAEQTTPVMAAAPQPNDTILGSAIARRLAAEQPLRRVEASAEPMASPPPPAAPAPNADLANASAKIVTGQASMAAQRAMSGAGADRTRAGIGQLAAGGVVAAERMATAAKAADMAGNSVPSAARIAAVSGIAAGECYRVESSAPATWGSVRLPMIVAVDSTGVEARVLEPNGVDTEARAYLQYNGADSAQFALRRIGFSGSMTLLASGGTRTGTMRSSSAQAAPMSSAPSRRAAMSASVVNNGGASASTAITARRVACPTQAQ